MKKQSLLSTLTMILIVFTYACKGPKGDPGPAGPEGPKGIGIDSNLIFGTKEGYIKGHASGLTSDGEAYSFPFELTKNYYEINNYQILSDGSIEVHVSKGMGVSANDGSEGYVSLDFVMDSLASSDTVKLKYFDITFVNLIEPGHFIKFDKSISSSNLNKEQKITVSEVTYDKDTRIISGKFSASFPASEGAASLTITDGVFSSQLSRISSREGAE